MDEEQASANAEMRYLTLELMKIAAKRKSSFADVTNEFIDNVYSLEKLVQRKSAKKSKQPGVALGGKSGRQ